MESSFSCQSLALLACRLIHHLILGMNSFSLVIVILTHIKSLYGMIAVLEIHSVV